jgi:hypothetical protein
MMPAEFVASGVSVSTDAGTEALDLRQQGVSGKAVEILVHFSPSLTPKRNVREGRAVQTVL